jgi:hypothetical protein
VYKTNLNNPALIVLQFLISSAAVAPHLLHYDVLKMAERRKSWFGEEIVVYRNWPEFFVIFHAVYEEIVTSLLGCYLFSDNTDSPST